MALTPAEKQQRYRDRGKGRLPPVVRNVPRERLELDLEMVRAAAAKVAATTTRPVSITTREECLTSLSHEAVDFDSPPGTRVQALRALADLLPPSTSVGDADDWKLLSDVDLETVLSILSKLKKQE